MALNTFDTDKIKNQKLYTAQLCARPSNIMVDFFRQIPTAKQALRYCRLLKYLVSLTSSIFSEYLCNKPATPRFLHYHIITLKYQANQIDKASQTTFIQILKILSLSDQLAYRTLQPPTLGFDCFQSSGRPGLCWLLRCHSIVLKGGNYLIYINNKTQLQKYVTGKKKSFIIRLPHRQDAIDEK